MLITNGGTKMRKPQAALKVRPIIMLSNVFIDTTTNTVIVRGYHWRSPSIIYFLSRGRTSNDREAKF